MSIKDQERLEELRQRLYERGRPKKDLSTYELKDEPTPVATDWKEPPKPIEPKPVKKKVTESDIVSPDPVVEQEVEPVLTQSDTLEFVKKKKTYRLKLMLLGIAFFVVSVGLSSLFLMSGGNSISGENISIAVTGPFAIGGGEAIPLQVGITNDNNVPIESATLIVEYPKGTRSVSDNGKDLFIERLSLDTVNSGETLNIPLRALVFGEENDEKDIKVSIEYRVKGSNALFFKEADPLRFKISSSPIVLNVANTVKISSGQETSITLTVSSNSPTPLSEILVKADYPNGFDFTNSEPSPDYAQNMWLIKNLEPESSQTITLNGTMVGNETDEYAINLSVGVPSERNSQELASVFVTDRIDFEIEHPFIDIAMTIAGQKSDEVAIEPGEQASVVVEVSNALEETLYDTAITVELSGNALSEIDVNSQNGFYNSLNNTITWDVGNYDSLEEITPGNKERVSFTIEPASGVNRTPQIDIKVKVESRRVSESRVAEKLEGTANAVVKVISVPVLSSGIGFNNSVFTDTGSIPPVAEEPTTYTLSMMLNNGSNDVTDAEVTASLPPYVTWLGESSGSGNIDFNSVNRVLSWNPGKLEASASAFVSFQVRFLPSQSQIGTTPTLLGEQRLKATDRFTGTVVRNTSPALTTELGADFEKGTGNGKVVAGN